MCMCMCTYMDECVCVGVSQCALYCPHRIHYCEPHDTSGGPFSPTCQLHEVSCDFLDWANEWLSMAF